MVSVLLHRRASLLALALLCAVSPACAQSGFQPYIGQEGKDVVWVPTPDEVVERMLHMAQTKANDYVIDLGAGDGKIAIAAAKDFGARALGIEYNPKMVKFAQRNAQDAGVTGKAQIIQGDIFATDFSQATVLTLYLLPVLNMKLRPQILAMRPGTRVVAHAFDMENWEPDETSDVDGRHIFLWIVPARVAGRWALEFASPRGSERLSVNFDQTFQKITGVVHLGPVAAGLRGARLRGFDIDFAYVDNRGLRRDFSGRVVGAAMEGSFRSDAGDEGRWSAVKR